MEHDNTGTTDNAASEARDAGNDSVATSSPGVGYRRPPVKNQFQKGRSGNRAGRPAGSRNFCKIVESVLRESIRTPSGRRVSKAEALVKRALYDSMKGDPKAIKALDFLAENVGLLNPPEGNDGRRYGYLCVPRQMPRDEWQKVALRALEHNLQPDPGFKPQGLPPVPPGYKLCRDLDTLKPVFRPIDKIS